MGEFLGDTCCRVCLEFKVDTLITKMFEQKLDNNNHAMESLASQMFNAFHVHYENSEMLPSGVCSDCLFSIQSFIKFRDIVHRNEEKLKTNFQEVRQLQQGVSVTETHRPGLNGNPGVFVPEEDCDIIEIDPDQEFESSGDEFSMESDTDNEEVSSQSYAALPNAVSPRSEPPQNVAPIAAVPQLPVTETFAYEITPKNTFLCKYCDVAFITQPECEVHESHHDSIYPHVCNFCTFSSDVRQTVINHIRKEHDAERPYVCYLCNKGFCRRSDLKKHSIVHTGVRPYSCPICSKGFSRNTNLQKHIRIHSSDKPHSCLLCPRSFSSNLELESHMNTHNVSRSFKCQFCSSSFQRREALKAHEQIHYHQNKDLPNQSKMNGASDGSFAMGNQFENTASYNSYQQNEQQILAEDTLRSNILASHLQQRPVAVSIKPTSGSKQSRTFTCDICSKTFTREIDLQQHQALHLDSLFTCKTCKMAFGRIEKLQRHEQECHAIRYKCEVCNINYSSQDSLDLHMKIHELQQNAAQAAFHGQGFAGINQPPPQLMREMPFQPQRPSESDMSFYQQLVPTMNLGFYSEAQPDNIGKRI